MMRPASPCSPPPCSSPAWLLAPALMVPGRMTASDHADTAENYDRIGADMTDVFIFPSPTNANNVVIVDGRPRPDPRRPDRRPFDPQVLYQMKMITSPATTSRTW